LYDDKNCLDGCITFSFICIAESLSIRLPHTECIARELRVWRKFLSHPWHQCTYCVCAFECLRKQEAQGPGTQLTGADGKKPDFEISLVDMHGNTFLPLLHFQLNVFEEELSK
jgi:hypothetical protein